MEKLQQKYMTEESTSAMQTLPATSSTNLVKEKNISALSYHFLFLTYNFFTACN